MVFILLYIIIILAVVEINVMIFTFTGLDHHISRFQVISMLTGTGFTTGESELIIKHPVRRKLSAFLILFGAFSLAVIISSISNVLSKNLFTKEISYIAGFLAILILLLKLPPLQKHLSKSFRGKIKKVYDVEDLPVREIFLKNQEDCFADIRISENSIYVGKRITDQIAKDGDINLLFIQRGNSRIRKGRLLTILKEGDVLFLYGDRQEIRGKFNFEIKMEKEESNSSEVTPL